MVRAGSASLAAVSLSMLAATTGLAAPAVQPESAASAGKPDSSAHVLPARPPLELVPPREGAEFRVPDPQGTRSQDREFARRMRHLYQESIDAADVQIANGRSTRLKAMARRVAAAEREELAELERWIARQKLRITQEGPSPQITERADGHS